MSILQKFQTEQNLIHMSMSDLPQVRHRLRDLHSFGGPI